MMRRIRSLKHAWFLMLLTATVFTALGAAGCSEGEARAGTRVEQAGKKYRCPMHPDVVSDHPGDCPICGMRLVEFTPTSAPAPAKPPETPPPAPPAGHEGHAAAGPVGTPPPADSTAHDHAPMAMNLGADRARLAGIRTTAATTGELSSGIRAAGTVAIDETRVRQVTTKVAGFVERLYVNTTGQMVRAGQPLFDLYSPELLASQEEYLRARESAATFQQSSLPEVQRGGADLVAASRRRLELFDVPAAFIERLEQTGKAQRTVTFTAPFAGFVTGKNVVAGQRIEPGMDLLTVSDLSRVWVMAQVYEAEASLAQPGRSAVVTLPYDEAARLTGRVDFVSPTLEAESRTLKVRLAFANPRGALKPGMFVNVELKGAAQRGVLVPDSAVLDSGPRRLVFVESAPGQFVARDVVVGARKDGQALLRGGLSAGEQVAVSANFLLDSESRLRNAVAQHSHQ